MGFHAYFTGRNRYDPSEGNQSSMSQVCDQNLSRRRFLEFLCQGAVAAAGTSAVGSLLSACVAAPARPGGGVLKGIAPSSEDALLLAEGLGYSILFKRGDPINVNERFGDCNDFTAFVPLDPAQHSDGLLWVNHEFFMPVFVSGGPIPRNSKRNRDDVLREQLEVGGSIVRIRRGRDGRWEPVRDDSRNRRITAQTRIPFAWDHPIAGAREAVGTLGNCAGGTTPWGTILTCEEQHLEFYGERDYVDGVPGGRAKDTCIYGWETVFDYPPEHYGWTVEVDPRTGQAKKLVALGRFGKEGATVARGKDGRCVVYSGDDEMDRCLYKFIADSPGTLERGTLYCADIAQGRWIPLSLEANPRLKPYFKDQTDLLTRARLAALLAGGTQLDRPEDIEIDPASGAVFVSLTNHAGKGNHFGSILRIQEKEGDPLSLEFESSTFKSGGPETGFACPDNLAFDRKGNLWFTSDISSSSLGKAQYAAFMNNGLFVVPLTGRGAGKVTQVASAPVHAELTGISFSPDGKTLFLSVQHPGEETKDQSVPTSRWPLGGIEIPRSAVVAIEGPALDALMIG